MCGMFICVPKKGGQGNLMKVFMSFSFFFCSYETEESDSLMDDFVYLPSGE